VRAAELYRRFAEVEAHGLSPMYEEWALGVARDPELCALIDALPEPKRQVNLMFAAARWHGVPLGPWDAAREWMLAHWAELVPTILTRATQTNEAGRCATLLPVLARVDGPLALLEVGASAGLCLFPDRYGYRYTTEDGTTELGPGREVILPCDLVGVVAPEHLPEVTWRAGIDLNPLDLTDAGDRAWLEALVWPEHEDRRARLAAASLVVAADPPRIVRGDLVDRLIETAVQAPDDATLVIYHSAVLVYLSPERRAAFRERVRAIAERRPVVWVSNEAPGVFGDVDAALPTDLDTRGTFVLSVDGAPVALTQPHGRAYRAL
jgi:hypothetical protein